ncbi:unnamed protein product [Microthlaspi erraticum]|uniref:Neprosin PEP catalytic domain-containing protein n=1 Tax=Microthlaspi erraticum TaxID=1685480 RepID=A0A6D2KWN0_9BRAS|nr:unnamed protein product [Microthlaspi erraticum]
MSFSEKLLLLFFSAVALILVVESHRKTPLKEEENELERLLKYINKPAIKSFQTEHGDILDCIDIQKQLAFDHPLLKNHSIQFAVGEYKYYHYGAKGNLNLWEPEVSPTQFSSASMLIAGGSNEQFQAIRAGWIVYQWLTKNQSRLFTYWTADGFTKTGCYNTLCPGFVQVSTKLPLGLLLQPVSRYGGQQYEVNVSIYQVLPVFYKLFT